MSLSNDDLHRLRLFNEKADKLLRSSFVEQIFARQNSVTITWSVDQPLSVERIGATEEATDAFALTLRFFVQDRDRIKLDGMLELYLRSKLPAARTEQIKQSFANYFQWRDAPIGFTFRGVELTNEKIINTVLYGDLAHANRKEYPLIEEWRQSKSVDQLTNHFFEGAVAGVAQFIFFCRSINEEILQSLEPETMV
ncbi:MAG: hypothetical protein NTV70_04540 [Acidobacteria bacterium]|nr:hypothetical protein [Acidobacteriota bacterium]